MKHAIIIAILFGFVGISTASAGTNSPGVDWRERNQMKRIGKGIRSGEITRREGRHLMRQQVRTRRMERRFKSDGHLSGRERVRLHRRLNRNSRHIYRAKHNRRRR